MNSKNVAEMFHDIADEWGTIIGYQNTKESESSKYLLLYCIYNVPVTCSLMGNKDMKPVKSSSMVNEFLMPLILGVYDPNISA